MQQPQPAGVCGSRKGWAKWHTHLLPPPSLTLFPNRMLRPANRPRRARPHRVVTFWPDMAPAGGGPARVPTWTCSSPPVSTCRKHGPPTTAAQAVTCAHCACAMPRARMLTQLLPLLLLLPHAHCALHPYDGVFQPLGDAFVYRAGREGLFKSRPQVRRSLCPGVDRPGLQPSLPDTPHFPVASVTPGQSAAVTWRGRRGVVHPPGRGVYVRVRDARCGDVVNGGGA